MRKLAMKHEAKVITHRVSVAMTKEEQAFYNFAEDRLKRLNVSRMKSLKLLNTALDSTSAKDITLTKHREQYFVGSAIRKKSLAKTQQVEKILEDLGDKSLVIYVLDDNVGKELASDLREVVWLDVKSSNDPESTINNCIVKQGSVPIVNISHCMTGIDIHADAVLWFQTPLSASEDLQGSGRITRLSSDAKTEKHVYYLYYNNTLQEEWIRELAEAYAINLSFANKDNESKPTMPMGLRF